MPQSSQGFIDAADRSVVDDLSVASRSYTERLHGASKPLMGAAVPRSGFQTPISPPVVRSDFKSIHPQSSFVRPLPTTRRSLSVSRDLTNRDTKEASFGQPLATTPRYSHSHASLANERTGSIDIREHLVGYQQHRTSWSAYAAVGISIVLLSILGIWFAGSRPMDNLAYLTKPDAQRFEAPHC